MIPFKQLPQSVRVPLFYAEVDNSQANSAVATQRALIIGQITSDGTAVPNIPIISEGVGEAVLAGGPGSMLALMTAAYRMNDTFGEVWYLPLVDAYGSSAAAGTVRFNAAATANGTLSLYIGGVRYSLPVLTAQTTAVIATALAALVNSDAACPLTASVTGSVVTLTAVNHGPVGNTIDIRINYQGTRGGEAMPTGLALNITQMTGGATAPSLTAALANLGSKTFDFIVCPYTDTTSLDALKTFLNDLTGRWSWNQQLYGHVFTAASGSLGELVTLGTARNNQHESIMGFYDSPTPAYIWASAMAGAAGTSLRNDPALPLQTVVLQGVQAPPLQSRFPLTDRNTLLYDGIATFMVADDGTVAIENLITTYQLNAFGSADNSYLEVETLFTLAYVLRFMKSAITSKYSRVKLAANGTRFAAGSAVVTPNVIRAELISQFRQLEYLGLVQNGDAFAASLIVEQNATNPNRVDVLWPGTLIDQLRVFAVLAQFRLS